MKNSVIILLALVASFSFTSCGEKGISKEMKTKMETFEASWKTSGDEMKTMETSINARIEEMKKMHSDAMGMMHHEDMKMDSKDMAHDDMHMGMEQCTNIDQRIAAMKTACDASMAGWDADTKAYQAWKETVLKGGVDNEAVAAALTTWEEKLAKYKADGMKMAADMDALYAEVKTHAEADKAMMMAPMK